MRLSWTEDRFFPEPCGAKANRGIDGVKVFRMMPGTAGAEQVPQPGLSDSGKEALLSRAVLSAEVIAYDDLGPEALRRLEVKDLPVTVVDDATGRGLYEEGRVQYRRVTHPA